MKIESVTLCELQIPLVDFFETSFGRITARRILLVRLQGDGIEGWGECVADDDPFYSEESIDTAWLIAEKYLVPAVLGEVVNAGREMPALFSRVRGHRMAKAAFENAMWDAEAQWLQIPLWKLLGGSQRDIPCGVSIGIQNSHEQLLAKIERELSAGYQRIKVKVKPGWDLNVLEKIRDQWPEILLSCDANSAYSPADTEHLKKLDRFELLMIEQPLWSDDIFFHASLQRELTTALCLDESIRNARDAEMALELGACRILNIKVGRVGGFSEAIAIHDVARKFGVPVWCGGMVEAGLGRSHNVALSTLPGFTLPGDVSASKRYWKEDIIEPEVTVTAEGTIQVNNQPGRGYELRRDVIEQLTVRKQEMRR